MRSKPDRKKLELKKILGRSGANHKLHLPSHLALVKRGKEAPAPQRASPNLAKAVKTWTRPGSPVKKSRLLQSFGKQRIFALGISRFPDKKAQSRTVSRATLGQSPGPKALLPKRLRGLGQSRL